MNSSINDKDEFGTVLEQLRKVQAAMRVCIRAIQEARRRAWEWRDRRDELRSETPVIHDQISEQRLARDELNAEVQQQKKHRDSEIERARVLQERLDELRGQRANHREVVSIEELQQRFRELEWKQQTTTLSIEQERSLLEELDELTKAMERASRTPQKPTNLTQEMNGLWQEIQEARDKAQEHHEKMIALVEEAQQKHQYVMQLSNSLGPSRSEVDEAHQMYVQCLQEADEMRERLEELGAQEVELKKQLDTIRNTRKEARQTREKAAMKKLAEQARAKQQSGQKLTLEEFRALMETNDSD